MPYKYPKDDDQFFNTEWWNGAAARLEAHLPGSVVLSYKDISKPGKPMKMVISGYEVCLPFAEKRIKQFGKFDVSRRIGDKRLCLLYCTHHRKMTAEAFDIAESADPATSAILNMLGH